MDFQDQKTAPPKASKEKVARNPNNANILKGGKVDPRSQLYQRSVAGREQLKDYLSRLSSSGADEADIFMAGVTSLMKRGHGYVGAYLDSKNPGRRYEKNQAMAITDKVMTDEGIGENPGARLTRPKVTDEEGKVDKEATKEARDKRKEENTGRGFGPQQAPGPSAKPVGQQRKEGKRESTGEALKDSRRDTKIGKPGEGPIYQPVSKKDGSGSVDVERKWQQEMSSGFEKIKKDLKNGAITPEEAKSQISELNSRSKEFLAQGKQEREQGLKDDAAVYKRREDRKKQRDGGQPPAGEDESPEETTEEKSFLTRDQANELNKQFKASFQNYHKNRSGKVTVEDIDEIIDDLSGYLDLDSKLVSDYVSDAFPTAMSKIGWSAKTPPGPETGGQEAAGPEPTAGAPEPEQKAPAPGPAQQGGASPISSEKVLDDFLEAYGDYLMDPDDWSGSKTKKAINSYIKETAGDYGVKPQDIVSAIRSDERGGVILKRHGFGASSLVRKPPKQTTEPAPAPASPEQQEEAAPTAPAPVPAAPPKKPGRGLNVPARPARKGGDGFTPEAGKRVMDTIRQAANSGKTPKQVAKELVQGDLFGGAGFETGSAATNPLEDSPPDQYERFRGDPAEKFKGAQEGGRELPTAGRGQEGQGSLLKKGTMEARGDFRKGAKPKPPRPAQPGPKSYEQTGLFGKDDFKSDQAGEPAPTESAPPDEAKPTESPGQKTFLSKAKGKETQILPSAIQVPKPGQGVTDAESYTKQLLDAGIPPDKINQVVKKTYGTKPRGRARPKGPKVNNSAEYQEFAQSVRSMMR